VSDDSGVPNRTTSAGAQIERPAIVVVGHARTYRLYSVASLLSAIAMFVTMFAGLYACQGFMQRVDDAEADDVILSWANAGYLSWGLVFVFFLTSHHFYRKRIAFLKSLGLLPAKSPPAQ
jgi:hypothetical protein